MAYGTLLSELLLMLKAEIGSSLTTGVAMSDDVVLRRLLSNKQKALIHEYDFPNLNVRAEQAIAAQYGTFPATVSRDRPVLVEVDQDDVWVPLDYGIGAEQYLQYGPTETSDPIRRWQFRNDGSVTPASLTLDRFEVWPVPASSQQVAFTGTMVLPPLLADTDRAVLDDMMLVLFVAADRLRRYDQKDADLKLGQAQQIAGRLAATLPRSEPVFCLGGSRGMATEPRLTKIRAI
jgi:hypothetical protein